MPARREEPVHSNVNNERKQQRHQIASSVVSIKSSHMQSNQAFKDETPEWQPRLSQSLVSRTINRAKESDTKVRGLDN